MERFPSGGGQGLPEAASFARGPSGVLSLSPSGSPGVLPPVSEHQVRHLRVHGSTLHLTLALAFCTGL